MRARVAEQDWLTLERLPAYASELNPVELLWSSLKKRELANLAGDHLAHTGLTIHPPHPPNLRKDQVGPQRINVLLPVMRLVVVLFTCP
ncbi:transposase [Actinosynnema sp. NPDC091369]